MIKESEEFLEMTKAFNDLRKLLKTLIKSFRIQLKADRDSVKERIEFSEKHMSMPPEEDCQTLNVFFATRRMVGLMNQNILVAEPYVIDAVDRAFVTPIQGFLETDLKNVKEIMSVYENTKVHYEQARSKKQKKEREHKANPNISERKKESELAPLRKEVENTEKKFHHARTEFWTALCQVQQVVNSRLVELLGEYLQFQYHCYATVLQNLSELRFDIHASYTKQSPAHDDIYANEKTFTGNYCMPVDEDNTGHATIRESRMGSPLRKKDSMSPPIRTPSTISRKKSPFRKVTGSLRVKKQIQQQPEADPPEVEVADPAVVVQRRFRSYSALKKEKEKMEKTVGSAAIEEEDSNSRPSSSPKKRGGKIIRKKNPASE